VAFPQSKTPPRSLRPGILGQASVASMSEMGQLPTSRHATEFVRFVPIADIRDKGSAVLIRPCAGVTEWPSEMYAPLLTDANT
jgi:hypothetical protein